ncbi:hypothetical protein AB4Y90_17915 [Chryseobacterium sp. 2TAF14]|uniref:hypothetical protein n=1 Tax=Chryseobacterium sp. 2TAF14 TaxID=3233007 RepID=UPI003F8E27E3
MMCLYKAQNVTDSTLRKDFSQLYYQETISADEKIALGEKMLRISGNENETSKSYQRIAEGRKMLLKSLTILL